MSDPVKDNMSMFNPVDMASMKKEASVGAGPMGGMDRETTVRDFLGKMGIDVDGPVTQLSDLVKSQTEKANPLTKMQKISGGPGPGGANQGAQPPMPEPAGLAGLMK